VKPKFFTAVLLFISAYSPLFIILAVKDYDFTCQTLNHPIPVIVMLSITTLSIILLFISINSIKRGTMTIDVVAVRNRSVDLINYTIPYMLSFFGIDLSRPADVISIAIFLLIMLLLTITSKSIFLNPILALVGYGLYDLDYRFDGKVSSVIVISKFEMRTGDRFYIRSLTRFLYFVTAEEIPN
jgi:hypothetical protein